MFATFSMDLSSMLPMLMVNYARNAHLTVVQGATTRLEPLQALLFTSTAGEAVVNFMLEPMMAPNEWQAIERHGQERKWTRLSRELGLGPALERAREPLAGFLRTLEARHHIVHFQHGKNVQRVESPPIPLTSGQAFLPMSAMRAVSPAAAEDALRPENAVTYFPSLDRLLRYVLPAYRRREDGFGLYFEYALEGKVKEG